MNIKRVISTSGTTRAIRRRQQHHPTFSLCASSTIANGVYTTGSIPLQKNQHQHYHHRRRKEVLSIGGKNLPVFSTEYPHEYQYHNGYNVSGRMAFSTNRANDGSGGEGSDHRSNGRNQKRNRRGRRRRRGRGTGKDSASSTETSSGGGGGGGRRRSGETPTQPPPPSQRQQQQRRQREEVKNKTPTIPLNAIRRAVRKIERSTQTVRDNHPNTTTTTVSTTHRNTTNINSPPATIQPLPPPPSSSSSSSSSEQPTPSTTTTISKCQSIITILLSQRNAIPPLTSHQFHSGAHDPHHTARQSLIRDTLTLTDAFLTFLEKDNRRRLDSKDQTATVDILTALLLLLSETPPSSAEEEEEEEDNNTPTPTAAAAEATLTILQTLTNPAQLNRASIRPDQYRFAIRTLCACRRFDEASGLFRRQIDVDLGGGWVPMEGELGWDGAVEMGLWGVAMGDGGGEGGGREVVERVMEGVMSMGMVSPGDSDRYVLSAGAALGRAGEWRSLLEYVEDGGEHSSQLGQPLIAAAMIACLHNDEPMTALTHLYYPYADPTDSSSSSPSSEWQWSGTYGTVYPLCRDLALRAMGQSTTTITANGMEEVEEEEGIKEEIGTSYDAIDILNQILSERGTVSIDAIKGVLACCERDGNYRKGMNVLNLLLKHDNGTTGDDDFRLVSGCVPAMEYFLDSSTDSSSLNVSDNDDGDDKLSTRIRRDEETTNIATTERREWVDGTILASVIDTSNNAGEFGLAIYLCRSVPTSGAAVFPFSWNAETSPQTIYQADHTNDENNEKSYLVHSILHAQPSLHVNDKLLAATMFALCGLECPREAIELYKEVCGNDDNNEEKWRSSTDCRSYAESLRRATNEGSSNKKDVGRAWLRAYRHIDRVIDTLRLLRITRWDEKKDEDGFSGEGGEELLRRGIGEMMRSCTEAGHGSTGMHLARVASGILSQCRKEGHTGQQRQRSVTRAVQSFFVGRKDGYDDIRDSSDTKMLLVQDTGGEENISRYLISGDSILSPALETIRATSGVDDALALFYYACERNPNILSSSTTSSTSTNSTKKPNHRSWMNTTNAVVGMLIEKGSLEEAVSLYSTIPIQSRTPETYLTVALGLAADKRWADISSLYVTALENGCVTEDLCLLTMEGVAGQDMGGGRGKVRTLRGIAGDMAQLSGIKPGTWIVNHYWQLKRRIGFHHTRLLMWWNDPKETQTKELELALRQFEEGINRGLEVEEDVLRCVVKLVGVNHQRRQEHQQNRRRMVGWSDDAVDDDDVVDEGGSLPLLQERSVGMILTAVEEANRSGLGTERSFTFEVASSLRSIGANRECIEFVEGLVHRGIGVNKSTLEEATAAARAC